MAQAMEGFFMVEYFVKKLLELFANYENLLYLQNAYEDKLRTYMSVNRKEIRKDNELRTKLRNCFHYISGIRERTC